MTALPTCAQQEAPEPEVAFLYEVRVNPDRVAQYEEAVTKLLTIAQKTNHAYPWWTMVRNDYLYYFAIPVEDLADVGKLGTAFEKMMAEHGQELPALQEGNFQSGKGSVWVHRPDLSYIPNPPVGDIEKDLFRFWGFLYAKPLHEAQMEEMFRKYVELHTKIKSKMPFYTWVGDVGTEGPVYMWASYAASASAFWTAQEAVMQAAGELANTYWAETLEHTRKVEYFDGLYRPDLSYLPE